MSLSLNFYSCRTVTDLLPQMLPWARDLAVAGTAAAAGGPPGPAPGRAGTPAPLRLVPCTP